MPTSVKPNAAHRSGVVVVVAVVVAMVVVVVVVVVVVLVVVLVVVGAVVVAAVVAAPLMLGILILLYNHYRQHYRCNLLAVLRYHFLAFRSVIVWLSHPCVPPLLALPLITQDSNNSQMCES